MAVATTGHETLSPDSVGDMLEELLEAQNQSYVLGLKLKLPLHVVEAIHTTYLQPGDRLLHVLIEFTKQIKPRPTWRVIIDALRTRVVNLPHLARKVEAVHFSHPTCDVKSETAPMGTQNEMVTDVSHDVTTSEQTPLTPSAAPVQATSNSHPSQLRPTTGDSLPINETALPSPEPRPLSCQDVKVKIRNLEKRFNNLKKATKECLKKHRITVQSVADALTSLPADDVVEHKQFLESHVSAFYKAINHSELFGIMNPNWNYLSYHLLDHLIQEFDLDEVKGEMKTYKEDLRQFREKTPLNLFCQTQKKRQMRLEPAFQEMVARFDWPDDATLEDVEQFRQEYAYHYGLQECAMMCAQFCGGSFIITWCIPESIVEKLRVNMPRQILKDYSVTELMIAGRCVYRLRQHKGPTKTLASSYGPSTGATVASVANPHDGTALVGGAVSHATEQEYFFVEEPSKDFFCPVTYGLLLQPHLTECCGKHLSQKAVTRIQKEGRACPMCKTAPLNTMFNKHFLRQVNELRVFCHHEDRRCGWQGELSDSKRHIQSCPMSNTPLMTELLKRPLYHDREKTSEDNVAGHKVHAKTTSIQRTKELSRSNTPAMGVTSTDQPKKLSRIAESNSLTVAVVGSAVQGKSTLIDSLFLTDLESPKAAMAGDWDEDVCCYLKSREGTTVRIWETSAAGTHVSGIIRKLREGTGNEVDLCLFCIAYCRDVKVDDGHRNVIKFLTEEFGRKFWKKVLFVMTMVNLVDDPKAIPILQRDIQHELMLALRDAGVPEDIVRDQQLLLAGIGKEPLLVNDKYEDWNDKLFLHCFEAIQSESKRVTFTKARYGRSLWRQILAEVASAITTTGSKLAAVGGTIISARK